MRQSNTAFFHPSKDMITPGLALTELEHPDARAPAPALLLGAKGRIPGSAASCAAPGSTALFALDGHDLSIDGGKLAFASVIETRPSPGAPLTPWLSSLVEQGTGLILVRTGLLGKQRLGGEEPLPHGAIPLRGNPRLIARFRSAEPIPLRAEALYELREGDQLLVSDVVPGRECVLGWSRGAFLLLDAPDGAKALIRQAFASIALAA
jgi:hypothetical protein